MKTKPLSYCKLLLFIFTVCFYSIGNGQQLISEKKEIDGFSIGDASIYVDENDFATVKKAAMLLQQDMEMVTGKKPALVNKINASSKAFIIIGSVEKSALIQQLLKQKKINPTNIIGKWEAYQIQSVANPVAGISNALVITGSDRRGTAFGVFELSKQIGVSPWYWWADVPVKKKATIYVKSGVVLTDLPKVKYRGIFINDEAPALSGWTKEKFGGFNHQFYEKVFELILRLKSNYLWPAMWGNAFYDDDSLNIKAADAYGIVIGTSHHEPLMRAHDEWRRYGNGKWNYDSNENRLQDFWRAGMKRATNEKIVSIGMRGDGDEPMTRETATALLERIVKDQRKIIEEITGKPASETPQLWALYKEVQDYYDKGMRVPDDVTLLLCDDNWGNIRKLPKLEDKPRKGGYGIYYHFDYVGGPRNYKWLNTNSIPRVWEQMHLAYQYGVDKIWIVNVGDIKPMEFPISFFLDYAWNPNKISVDDLAKYTKQWCSQQFGEAFAARIADIISSYTKFNSRRKPELLDAKTYSIENYSEAQLVTHQYNELLAKAEKINNELPAAYKDAFFELVLHPVRACANLQELYTTVALNHQAAAKKRNPNSLAEQAKQLYFKDSLISIQYNTLANGKWNHMMDQTHIGYTYWQQPTVQKMPDLDFVAQDSTSHDTKVEIQDISITSTEADPGPMAVKKNIFQEVDGCVSIEASHFTNSVNGKNVTWKVLPGIGRTGDAVTIYPVTAATKMPTQGSPQLQYEFYTYSKGDVKLNTYLSPTLNFHHTETGLRFAVSIDNEQPQIISFNKEDNNVQAWESWVASNIIIKTTSHTLAVPGKHVLKFWMVDSGVVLQKLVIDLGGVKPSYLGPPETMQK